MCLMMFLNSQNIASYAKLSLQNTEKFSNEWAF